MVSKADRRASREAAAAALWASHDEAAWAAALAAYPARRPDPHTHAAYYARADAAPSLSTLTKNDIIAAVTFKNARGTPRPLLHHARALGEADVEAAARAAARALGDGGAEPSTAQLSAACAALETLKGVGPATASLLISDCCASVPFLSDEASAVVLGRRDYRRADVVELARALRARAGELGLTARDVERALFSESRAKEGGEENAKKAAKPPAAAATGKKRKAAAK